MNEITGGKGKPPLPFMLARETVKALPAAKAKHPRSEKVSTRKSSARSSTGNGIASIMGVALSKPDKVFWPDAGDHAPVSKRDLAQYYEAVGEWMMPHLAGRPCSLLRAPDGIGGEQFFQRHAMAGISKLFTLTKVKGERAPYVQIDRIEALAAVAQVGALEIIPGTAHLTARKSPGASCLIWIQRLT